MQSKRFGFTMIELVFVIVVLGILAAIAIPKLAATRDDAQIAKGRSDVAAIRSAIVSERQTRLLKGESTYVSTLDGVSSNLFDGPDATHKLLQYGIAPQNANGHWHKANGKYIFKVMNVDNEFTYDSTNGTFNCTSGTYCGDLTN